MRSYPKDKSSPFVSRESLLLATLPARSFSLSIVLLHVKQGVMEFDLLLTFEQGKTLIWHQHPHIPANSSAFLSV